MIASYSLRKGITHASPALNAALTRHPQVQVAYLGTGRPADKVLVDYDPSVRGRVKVVPRYARTELPTLLKGYQIKLFPTLREGFGIALVEAMACGLAPIVTATPGPLRIVQDGHNALVVPGSDSRAMARALERLITDRALLDMLRRNAHAMAQADTWSRIAQQRLQLYEEFLQARRQGE